MDGKPTIALLGPASGADEANLATVRAVAREVTQAGYALLVLSHDGMAEVARAAAHSGADVIVVPAANGDDPSASSTLAGMAFVLDQADALIVLPGDLQALATVLQVWAYGATTREAYRQVVLLGAAWQRTVEVLADAAGLDKRTRAMVTFADAPEEALRALRYYVGPATA